MKNIQKNKKIYCCDCGKLLGEYAYCNGRQLPVHHIDYNKKNNENWNLISLRDSCHSITNTNRKYWKKHFNRMIKGIYV